jgi:xylulokinase
VAADHILVGLDVGTTAVKAVAITPRGDVLARAEEGYPLSTPRPGWSEQDPEHWWRATEAALAALGVEEIAGIGLSGQMHGLVTLDEVDRVVRPAILWNDQRTAVECAEVEELIGPDRLIRDYIRLRLTGERAIDAADASGTLLFDVAGRRWSEEVLSALEVPADWLPRVLESPEVSGRTGRGVPVAAGAGDQAAAALGVGVDRPGPLSIVLGTSGVVFAALPEFASDPEARVHVFCHAVPGSWHAMGVMLSAAGSLRWLRDAFDGERAYVGLIAEAERWPPATEGLTFLPYLVGERTPHADPRARGAFVGLSVHHDRGALVRAVLEGVAYALRHSFELISRLGVERQVGRASGGGARSELWLRIIASVLDVPLERTVAEEGSAFGAALLGGVAKGVFRDVHEAVAACVRLRDRVEPVPEWREAYEAGYARFRSLYPALRPLEES